MGGKILRKITSILVLVLILGVIGISGCTTGVENKTYSANGLNLTYPADMKANATFIYVTAPTPEDKVDTIGNDKLVISIAYIPMNESLFSGFTFDGYKKLMYETLSNANNTRSTSLSVADKSKNGTAIFEEIYTSKDPVSGTELKTKRVLLFNNKKSVHQVAFQTKAADFESQIDTINAIQNSIVLT